MRAPGPHQEGLAGRPGRQAWQAGLVPHHSPPLKRYFFWCTVGGRKRAPTLEEVHGCLLTGGQVLQCFEALAIPAHVIWGSDYNM